MTRAPVIGKKFAASKYLLQIREKDYRGLRDDMNYTFHDTRGEAVKALAERERATIAAMEKTLKRASARLKAFVRKELAST